MDTNQSCIFLVVVYRYDCKIQDLVFENNVKEIIPFIRKKKAVYISIKCNINAKRVNPSSGELERTAGAEQLANKKLVRVCPQKPTTDHVHIGRETPCPQDHCRYCRDWVPGGGDVKMCAFWKEGDKGGGGDIFHQTDSKLINKYE
jgi:hypothetical protein